MGCLNSKEFPEDIEDDCFMKAEQLIGLCAHDSITIDRLIFRNSALGKISRIQLELTFKKLVEFSSIFSLLEEFREVDNFYNVKYVNTLGILLGKGNISDKVLLLFQTYDSDTSKTIQIVELEEMINQILNISLIYLPKYTTALNPNNEKLKEYASKLKLIKTGVSKHLLNLITQDKKIFNENELKSIFEKEKTISYLIHPKSIRIHAYMLYKGISKPLSIAMNLINNQSEPRKEGRALTVNEPNQNNRNRLRKLNTLSINLETLSSPGQSNVSYSRRGSTTNFRKQLTKNN